MIRSLILKRAKMFAVVAIIPICAFKYVLRPKTGEQEWLDWSNKCLNECYDPSNEAKLVKWELSITPDHYLRLRKTFPHERQEYFSLQLQRFNDLNYIGTDSLGTLQFKADTDDIIVQTYNDPKGDIDSTAVRLDLPVKHMQPERLDSLKSALTYLKSENL
ncbi:MAG: hypothetical protein JST32_13025 [Bacteroidetes bacterium]|nr:hypothetical protein [Bacteroidota bacterium]